MLTNTLDYQSSSHCDTQWCFFFNTMIHRACITQTATIATIYHRTLHGSMPTIVYWVQIKGLVFLTQRLPLHSGMWLLPKADLFLKVRKDTLYKLWLLPTSGRLTTLDLWPLPPPPPLQSFLVLSVVPHSCWHLF